MRREGNESKRDVKIVSDFSCGYINQELNLEGNELTSAGLTGLMGLRLLTKLDLGYNQISDLHSLCELTGLLQLSLESNLLHK